MDNYSAPDLSGFNVYLISPRVGYVFSSKYSRPYNDGPMWTGKGSTIEVNAGFKVKWGPITGVLYPNFYYAQNEHFQRQSPGKTGLNPRQNDLNYQLSNKIDWVQIFGYDPFTDFNLGQSSISLELGPASVKFGTENMWWGPAVLNPIMISNTAPGFPHLTLGTKKPLQSKFGDFELYAFWGQLKESQYFDDNPLNDKRLISGLSFGYRPSFAEDLKGISIGVGRIIYKAWPVTGISPGDMLLGFKKIGPNFEQDENGEIIYNEADQYNSLNVRWFLEESGVELYFEWVQNDAWLNSQDVLYTLGFQKLHQVDNATWRLGIEQTSLAAARTRENSKDLYTHPVVTQGFTNKGNLLGAPIGPGSKSQFIQLDRFNNKGKYGFSINRIRFNDDFFFRQFGPTGDFSRHDVEWNFELEAVRFLKNYEISGKFIYSRRMNWHFYHNLDVNNFQLLTSIKWHLINRPIITIGNKNRVIKQ
ncbi:MAG: capsule assembly Wzi family protein [Cyclobacteriaceae bacterium]